METFCHGEIVAEHQQQGGHMVMVQTGTAFDEEKGELMTGRIMTWRKFGGGAVDNTG